MTIAVDQVIAYMRALQRKGVTYSMRGSRTGADGTADCSGAVYAALCHGGMRKAGYVPSTETLHGLLLAAGFQLLATNREWEAQKGDIVILGRKGQSAGVFGHTAIFVDHDRVIHCNGRRNGVTVDPETVLPYQMGYYVYRLNAKARENVAQVQDKIRKRAGQQSERPLPLNVRKANGRLKVAMHATHWLTREKIHPSVLGKIYAYDALCDCQVSFSKRAYRLKQGTVYLGWLLEQDAELK